MSSKRMCQAALDWLHAHPNSTPRDVWEGTGKRWEVESVSRCLAELAEWGDCTRSLDSTVRGTPHRYVAVVLVPTQRPKRKEHKAPAPAEVCEPWRTVHIVGSKDKPIPAQGGQGAVRGYGGFSSLLGAGLLLVGEG